MHACSLLFKNCICCKNCSPLALSLSCRANSRVCASSFIPVFRFAFRVTSRYVGDLYDFQINPKKCAQISLSLTKFFAAFTMYAFLCTRAATANNRRRVCRKRIKCKFAFYSLVNHICLCETCKFLSRVKFVPINKISCVIMRHHRPSCRRPRGARTIFQ